MNSPISALLGTGLDTLDLSQEVTFQAYSRVVLPLDGYVFWKPTVTLKVSGALHHSMEMIQNETETLGLATVTFTTQQFVAEFAEAPINTIYVARRGEFRYAFSRQQGFFQAAGLWHFQGQSIQPAMASQLLDDPSSIDATRVVVSNSLPFWLALNGYQSPFQGGFSNVGDSEVTLYPSFIVEPNLPPPYCAVHIPPESTRALQGVPLISSVSAVINGKSVTLRRHQQLCQDRVRLTVYGLQNHEAQNFFDAILEVLGTAGQMGLVNMPVPVDGKRGQTELQAIAMQKTIEFDVSYNQLTATQVALKILESASASIYVSGLGKVA